MGREQIELRREQNTHDKECQETVNCHNNNNNNKTAIKEFRRDSKNNKKKSSILIQFAKWKPKYD